MLSEYLEVRSGERYFPRVDTPELRRIHELLVEFFSNFPWSDLAEEFSETDGNYYLGVGPWINHFATEFFTEDGLRLIKEKDFFLYYFLPVLEFVIWDHGFSYSLARPMEEHSYYQLLDEEERGETRIPSASVSDVCLRHSRTQNGPWPGAGPYMYLAGQVQYTSPERIIFIDFPTD